MMNKQQTFKSNSQFVKKQTPPKSPQGKPFVNRNKSKPKAKKTGKMMLGSAMKKLAAC